MKVNKTAVQLLMAEKGLNVTTLCKRAKMSKVTFYRMMNNNKHSMPITLGKLSEALEVKPIDIIDNEE